MRFTLVGTGRVAHFVARRLTAAGWICTGLYGRNKQAMIALAERIGNPPTPDFPENLDKNAELCLLAVSDDALTEVADSLPLQKGTVVHFSGTVPLHVLEKHSNRGVCWPVGSIQTALDATLQIPAFCLASDEVSLQRVKLLCEALHFRFYSGTAEQKAHLHVAAVFANNFTNHLLAICSKICKEQLLPQEILAPIVQQTAALFISGKSAESQTGPAIRRDQRTQEVHFSLLQDHPDWQALYEILSASIKKLHDIR